jgi:hypothetical protein
LTLADTSWIAWELCNASTFVLLDFSFGEYEMEALRLEVRQRAEGLDLLHFNCKSDSRILIASALHVLPGHLMFVANVTLGGKIAELKWELLISFPFHDNARKRRSWCHLVTV